MSARPDVRADIPAHRYDGRVVDEIETRWQAKWDADGTYFAPNPTGPLADGFEAMRGKPKTFVLDMFPYPSGDGLHVGHPLGFIGTDVYARYLRMTGHNVLHTMGFDAFGLPAEQYAVQTGQHPRITTEANVANYRRQLHRLGLGHDPRRSISTTDVTYYRWTQWIFLQDLQQLVRHRGEEGHARSTSSSLSSSLERGWFRTAATGASSTRCSDARLSTRSVSRTSTKRP